MLRRNFLKLSAMAGAATLFPSRAAYAAFAQIISLKKFIQPLRGLGPTGIPLAMPIQPSPYTGIDYYEIALRDFYDQLHPDLPPTRLYGYGNAADPRESFRHLGGVIVANRDRPVRIKFINQLPPTHILPVDTSIQAPN